MGRHVNSVAPGGTLDRRQLFAHLADDDGPDNGDHGQTPRAGGAKTGALAKAGILNCIEVV